MKLRFYSAIFFTLALASTQAATFTVSAIADAGPGSLRQAILDANGTAGDDTIVFTTNGIITLASSLPAITDNTTIAGPGTNLMTISGNNSVGIFSVSVTVTNATISGLTIANGKAVNYLNGAGISNAGTLTISNCALLNNKNFGGWGGAVYNAGTLAILDSIIFGNTVFGESGGDGGAFAGGGGGGAGMGGGLFTLSGHVEIRRSTFAGNQVFGGQGGAPGGSSGDYWGGRGGGINGGGPGYITGQRSGGGGGFGGGGGGGGFDGGGGSGGFGGAPGGNGGNNNQTGGGGGGAFGGGVFINNGLVAIVGCVFTNNSTSGGSGASGLGADLYNRAGKLTPTFTASTLGGGTLAVNPTNAPYLNNSLATVAATPGQGWQFLYWLGDAAGANTNIDVSVTRNKYVQAVFGTTLTTSGLILAYPQSAFYPYGTVVKLTAQPPNGTSFASWSGDVSGTNNPLNLTLTNGNLSVSCLLGSLNTGQFALTVIESGYGHVSVNPYANAYSNGQAVTLTPLPGAGQDFIAWSGDASGTQNPLLVPVSSNKVIAANFTKRPTLRVGTPLEGLVEDGFRLTILGDFGTPYSILGSTNLFDWTVIGTVTNAYGTVQLTDPIATNLSRRFYRATNP